MLDWLFATLLGPVSPQQQAAMRALEGEWGFVSSQPADSWFGAGFRDGAGVCGAPKSLRLDIREERAPDGTLEWRMRLHPEQPLGALITQVDIEGETQRVQAEFIAPAFGAELFVFERRGDELMLTQGDARLEFRRC